MSYLVIGITGPICSGKETVTEHLKQKGFIHFSPGDIVREEAKKAGVDTKDRFVLQNLGSKLRKESGEAVLVERLIKKIKKEKIKRVVVSKLVNPKEIKVLKDTFKDFYLVGLTAPKKERFRRMQARNKEGDPKTLKEFLKVDLKDRGASEEKSGQRVGDCLKMADIVIENKGKIAELLSKVDSALKE